MFYPSAGCTKVFLIFVSLLCLPLLAQAGFSDRESYPRKVGPEVPVGENMVSNGIPVTIHHFRTRDPVDMVLSYYEQQWRMKGYQLINRENLGDISVITVIIDPEKLLVKSVMAYRETSEEMTYVFPSTSVLDVAKLGKNPKEIPIFPDSQVVSSVESNDAGKHTVMVMHRNSAPIEENVNFYRSQMLSRGWRPIPAMNEVAKNSGESLFLTRGGSSCFISFANQEGTPGTFVVINLME